MKQEEIILLLTDTCGRLRSNLICKVTHKDSEGWKEEDMALKGVIDDEGYFTTEYGSAYSSEFKPYLRSMSSMSEEEMKKYRTLQDTACSYHYEFGDIVDDFLYFDNDVSLDYLNSIHIDYRGLIPMGLALEAKEGMYD